MALVIRLTKTGRTNRQSFRLIVTDKRTPRDGKYLEMVGWYNPLEEEKEKNLFIKSDRVEFWLSKGAQLSEKAKYLVKKAAPEIIKGLNEKKRLKKTKKVKPAAKTKAKK